MTTRVLLASAAAVLLAGPAMAQTSFSVRLSGLQEVPPVVGDPDGTGLALFTIFPGATPTISWSFTVENIELPTTLVHIHRGAAGTNGPVVVDFMNMLSGSGLADPDLNDVLANPTGFYVNIHNSVHPGGAVRGQIPAPAAAALLLGAAPLVLRRRR